MSVRSGEHGTIVLDGACGLEDAETLLRLLLEQPGAAVDVRGCDAMHAGVVQVLLCAAAEVVGPARGEFVRRHVVPVLGEG